MSDPKANPDVLHVDGNAGWRVLWSHPTGGDGRGDFWEDRETAEQIARVLKDAGCYNVWIVPAVRGKHDTPVSAEPSPNPLREAEEAARLITQAEATIQMGIDSAWLDRGERFRLALDDLRRARAVLTTDQSPSGNAIVYIARCPEHGLHGDRTDCFVCQGPVERVAMIPLGAPGGAVGERAATKEGGSAGD